MNAINPLYGLAPRWQAPTPADLLALARARYLDGERIDLPALAAQLGISRATAYRWAGNAEELAGRVIASLGEETFRRIAAQAQGEGAARVIDVIERGLRHIASLQRYRAFLERDPQRALRIVASKDGPVQRSTIALNQELLEEEIARGRLELPIDAHTMAYAMVRIAETFLYADLIAGEEPDVDKAVEILKLMLPDAPRRGACRRARRAMSGGKPPTRRKPRRQR